jgi:hypothetical protein
MSEQAPEYTQGQPVEAGTGTQESAAPWAEYLNDLPDSVRPLVEPKFREWDSNTTKRFQQVHSEYEPLKPFQSVMDNGWDFNDVQQALQLTTALNENPQAVYDALVANYGFGAPEQGQEDDEYPEDSLGYEDPRIAQIEQMTNAMAEMLLQQENQKQAVKEDAELDSLLASLKDQHGDFNEKYVMTQMYAGADPVAAIQEFQQMIGQAAAQRPQVPTIMGSGGGLPSQTVNPSQMSDKDRKNLVAQMIAQSQAQ